MRNNNIHSNPSNPSLRDVRDWNQWDLMLEKSEQASIFLKSTYLKACGIERAARFLLDGDQVVGGLVIPELFTDQLENPIRSYSTYQSVWFISLETDDFRKHQTRIRLLEVLGEIIAPSPTEIYLSLHWSIQDVRGLEWFFYENKIKSLQFQPRYTGLLDLKKYSDFSQYLQTISSGRKADFKLLSTVEISYNSSRADIADFLEMYSTTVPFKGAEDRELALTQVSNLIIQSIESGTGKLWLARDKSGHTISGVFFQEFANSLYYQFGASAPNELKYSPNAILLLRVIQEAFSAEINLIDFVGMNSPKRGSFKASFNPKPQLYFQIRIR